MTTAGTATAVPQQPYQLAVLGGTLLVADGPNNLVRAITVSSDHEQDEAGDGVAG